MFSESSCKIGIIFDLDGTILDSTGLISHIPAELEKKYQVSIDLSTTKEIENKILTTLKGRSSRLMIIRLIFFVARKYRVPWFLRLRYLKDAGKLYKSLIRSVPIFPGVRETLEFLSMRGIPIGLNTTSSEKEVIDRFENRMDLLEFFKDNIITRSDIKKLKPHPESIQRLSEKMGISIQNLVMIGDMDSDINAGKNAGCITIGVLTGYSTQDMMQHYHPDFIIKSVEDIPLIFSELIKSVNGK